MTTVLDDFKPSDFGLHQFEIFRTVQLEAIEQAVYEPERYQAMAPPTGSGKSLMAVMIHKLTGWRTGVLTATKGLEDQYKREFEQSAGMFDIRGRMNYRCRDRKNMNCGDGDRAGCRLIAPGPASQCNYDGSKRTARRTGYEG